MLKSGMIERCDRERVLHGDAAMRFDRANCKRFDLLCKAAVYCLLVALPFLSLLLLSLWSGNNCFAGHPVWSDELDYWREIYSFSESGDGGFGYYGFFGYPARLGQWGCHGIAPLLVYGLPSLVFGWGANSIVMANVVACSLALAVFVLLTRPSCVECGVVGLLWLFYVPIILYSASSMMELPQYAGMIVYIAIIARIYDQGKSKPIRLFLAAYIVVVIMSALRISNIVLFLLICLLWSNFRLDRKLLFSLGCSFIASLACWLFFSLFISGFPDSFLSRLMTEPSLMAKLALLSENVMGNIGNLATLLGSPIENMQRVFILLLIIFWIGVAICVEANRDRRDSLSEASLRLIRASVLCLFLVIPLAVIAICFYDVFDWRDYRTCAPVLFGAILLHLFLVKRSFFMRIVPLCGVVVVFALSFCLIPDAGSSFQGERYDRDFAATQCEASEMIESLGPYPADRTLVIENGITRLPFSLSSLDPQIGVLIAVDGADLANAGFAYVISEDRFSSLSGYAPIWIGDGWTLYKRQ